jgi:2,3-bisphosphoglycerate-independent phosphoglycerate mutase
MTSSVPRRPVLLVILDGFGVNPSPEHNAVAQANTPHLDAYFASHPHTLLKASGNAVGLPEGQMGNSEVGHLTIGCGSVVRQDLVAIHEAIHDGSFYSNAPLLAALDHARAKDRPVHLLGLVSDGGVHSHIDHLLALIESCRRQWVCPVLHMITDGRDTPPRSALGYLAPVEEALAEVGGRIASVSGRYYAMDRDNRWDRTELAWRCMVRAQGEQAATAHAAIEAAYAAELGDEFILPTVVDGGEPVLAGDSVIFFNFRKDRTRQLTSALFKPDFDAFERGDYTPVTVTCMTEYDEWFGLPFAFQHERPKTTLAEVISNLGLTQFHCAETEKYAHVTYFLNGGRGEALPGEERAIIDSPKVATYDLQPEMSAPQVADTVIEALQADKYAFIVVNFANGDMVGHTGMPTAIVQAVEALDREVGRVLAAAEAAGYSVLLTADHGNCEEMVDPNTGVPHTQHTQYPVPCLLMDNMPWHLSEGAGLSAIAPTVLELMGLPVPAVMEGHSLLMGVAVARHA